MRLIDADELKKALHNYYDELHSLKMVHNECSIFEVIDNAPTIPNKERPKNVSCENCKHGDKRLIEEPCNRCNEKCSEWEAEDETN